MNLKRIKNKITNFSTIQDNIKMAKKYYQNENDILSKGVVPRGECKDPLRTADNRIPHNFHEILVDEKASYLFTYPVLIDINNDDDLSKKVIDTLTPDFTRKLKNQCIETSNAGTSWMHYWIKVDKETKKNYFKYALVPTEEVIPIYNNGLERDLEAIIRTYNILEYVEDEDKEKTYRYIEYWTNNSMEMWKFDSKSDISESNYIENNKLQHNFGSVPFIEFANNFKKQSDLFKYLRLLDLYDRVMSGFANDLDDIQEIIYILENYGGENLHEFMSDLKKFKAIKTVTNSL